MKLFKCSGCGAVAFFESVRCESCGRTLAFLPDRADMGTFDAPPPAEGAEVVGERPGKYRLCANYTTHAVCNWAVPADGPGSLCRSCELNETIPNLSEPDALDAWRRLELEKRRLMFSLDALGLPVVPRTRDPAGLAFAFVRGGSTGHANGLITIDVAEASAPYRERVREELQETYRTVLGHFRHESGHYYWLRLIADQEDARTSFRALFGDERASYEEAKQRHYSAGPPADWRARYVSAYASMHPFEDWAETWAHYLHMVDTLQTARSYGLALRPRNAPIKDVVARRLDFDDFDDLIGAWVPLTLALNSLNRSMGLADLYAFVLSADAIAKLRFVHDTIERAQSQVPGIAAIQARISAAPSS